MKVNYFWFLYASAPQHKNANFLNQWERFVSTNQKHYPDLGSTVSSAWHVCICFIVGCFKKSTFFRSYFSSFRYVYLVPKLTGFDYLCSSILITGSISKKCWNGPRRKHFLNLLHHQNFIAIALVFSKVLKS